MPSCDYREWAIVAADCPEAPPRANRVFVNVSPYLMHMKINSVSVPRFLARPRACLLVATLGLATAGSAQSVINDTFDGAALDTDVWLFASAGNLGSGDLSGGILTLDTAQTTAHARAAVVSHDHDFNPFDQSLTVSLEGVSMTAAPDAAVNNASSSLYAVVGRLSSDVGGAAPADSPHNYSAGSPGYGTGAAFGISVVAFPNGTYRLQVLDSGNSLMGQTQLLLSEVPTDITWEIDGTTSTWEIAIEGATFTNILVAGLDSVIGADNASASGTFTNFTEAGLTANDTTVARFVVGVYNGNGVTTGVSGSFDTIAIAPTDAGSGEGETTLLFGFNEGTEGWFSTNAAFTVAQTTYADEGVLSINVAGAAEGTGNVNGAHRPARVNLNADQRAALHTTAAAEGMLKFDVILDPADVTAYTGPFSLSIRAEVSGAPSFFNSGNVVDVASWPTEVTTYPVEIPLADLPEGDGNAIALAIGVNTTWSTDVTIDYTVYVDNIRTVIGNEEEPMTPAERLAAAAAFFGEANDGDYIHSEAMGTLHVAFFPWVFSYAIHDARLGSSLIAQGWLYTYGPDYVNAAWFYDETLANWWFTVESVYPWVFIDGGDWAVIESPLPIITD